MRDIKVKDRDGNEVETLNLEEGIFGKYVNRQLLHDAVVMYEANKRQGTVSTKTRSEIAGSGRKPWRQKGTGRARAGTAKSPLWRKGGVTFGPKPRDYSYSMPKKAARKALTNAILHKIRKSQFHLIDKFDFEQPRTKLMAEILSNMGLQGSVCVITGPTEEKVYLSGRNIPKLVICAASDVNAYNILKAKNLLVSKEAFELLKKRAAGVTEGAPQQ